MNFIIFSLPFNFFKSSKQFFVFLFILFFQSGFAQDSAKIENELAYKKTINERVTKIVNKLNVEDSINFKKVVNIISNQYFALNNIHDEYKEKLKLIKANNSDKETVIQLEKDAEEIKNKSLRKQHKKFLNTLSKKLSEQQIDLVKNGMTYDVLNVTFKAYKAMLLNLTESQIEKIYNWLLEARELAMDEGSSNDKHKMFGKYKGKINNYLSAEGYDMKKEEDGWRERIKKEKENKKT